MKKKKSILSSNVDNKPENKDKFIDIKKEISNHIRSLRRQIDQYLIKNRKQAFFKNKIRFYDKEQILYDAEINFHQIKRLLTFNSTILKNDPSIAKHYLDLMNAITRKKILENSIANFEKPEFYSKTEEPEVEEKESDSLYDILYVDKIKSSEGEHKQEADNKELARSEERKLLNSQVAEKKTKEKLLKYFEEHVKSSLGIKESQAEEPKLKGKSKVKANAKETKSKGKSKSKGKDSKEVEDKFDVKLRLKTSVKTDSNLKKLKEKVGKKIEKQNAKDGRI